MIPSNAIRKAMYTALTGNSTLMAMVTGIYDNVPEATVTPYIRFGQVITFPMNTKGEKGHITTLTIDIFTEDDAGFKTALTILSEVDTTLDQQHLSLDAPFSHIYTMYRNHQELEEEDVDGIRTLHVASDYDIYTTGG
jgi:hypothetical protein